MEHLDRVVVPIEVQDREAGRGDDLECRDFQVEQDRRLLAVHVDAPGLLHGVCEGDVTDGRVVAIGRW
jgi:hypothetical protein